MSKTRTLRIGATTLATVLLISTAVLAQPPGRRGGGPPGGMLERMADKLDLSEEQRETIGGLFETHREGTAAMREDLDGFEEAVEVATHADPFDEEAVRAAATQVADVRVELAVARARLGQQIGEVLTPEQRQMAAEMRERRQDFRDEFGGGRGGQRFHGQGQRGKFGPRR